MELTDDRNGLKLQKSKRFCAIKGDNVISSIGAPLQTLGAPNTPLWIVHSDTSRLNQLFDNIYKEYTTAVFYSYS